MDVGYIAFAVFVFAVIACSLALLLNALWGLRGDGKSVKKPVPELFLLYPDDMEWEEVLASVNYRDDCAAGAEVSWKGRSYKVMRAKTGNKWLKRASGIDGTS